MLVMSERIGNKEGLLLRKSEKPQERRISKLVVNTEKGVAHARKGSRKTSPEGFLWWD